MLKNTELLNEMKQLRKKASLTQEELAKRIGVSRKTVNTIENGIFIPSTILAIKLSQELGVSVEELFQIKE